MLRYVIVKSGSLYELEEKVNKYISKGFIPQGGVSLAIKHISLSSAFGDIETREIYTQAMTKEEGEKIDDLDVRFTDIIST